MKMRAIDNNDIFSHLPREIRSNVLSRLEVKPLMRCKCVSKLWHSIISDPIFAQEHQTQSGCRRGILFSSMDSTYREQHFYFVPCGGQSAFPQFRLPLTMDANDDVVTEVVNGLVCSVDDEGLVSLSNVTTQETMTLPVSSFRGDRRYYFGFNPDTNEYKVLHVCIVYTFREEGGSDLAGPSWTWRLEMCEILTLGRDASWRRIDASLPYVPRGQSACFDGNLHWLVLTGDEKMSPNSQALLVFDLKLETFRVLPLPPSLANTEVDRILQHGGRLALASSKQCGLDCKLTLTYLSPRSDCDWITTVPHPVPRRALRLQCYTVVGSLITGEVLLGLPKLSFPLPLFSLDTSQQKWDMIVIGEFPRMEGGGGPPYGFRYRIHPHVDNILPLWIFSRSSGEMINNGPE